MGPFEALFRVAIKRSLRSEGLAYTKHLEDSPILGTEKRILLRIRGNFAHFRLGNPMIEIFDAIFSVRADTTYLVAGLTIASALMFLYMTDSRSLTLLFTPIAALGAFLGIYVSRELGLYYSADDDSNIIVSGLLGLFLSLTVVILTARLCFMIVNAIRRRQTARLRGGRD